MKRKQLMQLIKDKFDSFQKLNYNYKIVLNSISIVWFGNVEKYFKSKLKIITVSLNPSDIEFKDNKADAPTTNLRFPDYDGSVESLYSAYNKYFLKNPYNAWFKASFGAVLKSFNASHYENDSYATSPTWSKLTEHKKSILEPIGSKSWHSLMRILEPDIILFSASNNFEKKIKFHQEGNWAFKNVKAKKPLLIGRFNISTNKKAVVFISSTREKAFSTNKQRRETKVQRAY